MRNVRGVILAIAAALALLGGTATVASANPGSGSLEFDDSATASADPGDPGFPPDE